MKKFLLICIALIVVQEVFSQLTYKTLFVDYDSAIEFRQLKLIPVRMKGPATPARSLLTLNTALQKGMAVITERGTASTENVHWLRVRNKSTKPLYVASGELIAGGRQDRIVTRDTVLIPTGNDQYIQVMCVEEQRWSKKEKKFIYRQYANPKLRKVVDQGKNQVLIWKEVFAQIDSSRISAPTLSYVARRMDKKIIQQQEEYMHYFRNRISLQDSNIVGFVCLSGNKVIGSDILSNPMLFYEEFDALLTGYVEEAVSFGQKVTSSDDHVRKYMDKFMKDETQQEQYLQKNGKLFRFDGKLLHLTSYAE